MSELSKTEIDNLIKESIRTMLAANKQFTPTDTLVITTYSILKNIFVDEIKYVFLEAPTGAGKSVIAYMLHFCYTYIDKKMHDIEPLDETGKVVNTPQNTYLLTSSKMLQEQLDGDIVRFNLQDYLAMVKGVKNYECTKLTKETGIYHDYSERFCMGMKNQEKQLLACYDTCPYIQKRLEASGKDCTILNYSYFLNALKNPHNVFFKSRELTIADEAHLIPDIILEIYNIDLNLFKISQLHKILNQTQLNFGKELGNTIFELQEYLGECYQIFLKQLPTLDDVRHYFENLILLIKGIIALPNGLKSDAVFKEMFKKELDRLEDDLKSIDYEDYLDNLSQRSADCFIETEFVGHQPIDNIKSFPSGSYKVYKHKIYDLSESELCRKHFISKINVGIFMSATLGNIEEFALLMGLNKGEYNGFRLESNFNFDKSPIFLVNSGYLNYTNFEKNIDKVLYDTLRICEHHHPNDKGIIHTATFNIANNLKGKIYNRQGGVVNPKRYLFYENSTEKEACIELMKADTNIPYIIIGPSLYEGIDLKDGQGRFNIIVKTPYSGISNYIRKKMERFPFWYERQTLEKIVQSIGRTNRHPEDWSIIYVMDTVAEKIIFKMQRFMTDRIKYFKKL